MVGHLLSKFSFIRPGIYASSHSTPFYLSLSYPLITRRVEKAPSDLSSHPLLVGMYFSRTCRARICVCVCTCLFSWQKALRKADKVREIEWTMLVMRDRSSRCGRWWISLLDKRCTRGLLVSWGDSINKPWLRCHVPPMSKLTVFSSFD